MGPRQGPELLLLLLALTAAASLAGGKDAGKPPPAKPVHVAFLTDCQMYSDWQSVGMIFSFKMSGQPGKVTRVMCCSEAQRAKYNHDLLKAVETHVAPSMAVNPHNNDHYAAYNKPEAVIDWLDHVTPEEEYVLVLDSDMILRRPFLVEQMGPKPGLAIGARYTYMIGVNNELALRHIPEVAPRNDTLAGPYGRRADQVGGFFFMHRDDLKRMSHDWLKFSEDVRFDDQAYRLSGDVYAIHPGDRPWISEMYGYAFAAAKANVWHKWDIFSMIYPEYEPRDGIPKLMHYGLLFQIGDYSFDKHWHYDFDVTKCPPWDLTDPKRRTGGIFPHAPRPTELKNQKEFIMWYKDLLAIETVATLNAAFCAYHLEHCPPSEQLLTVCKETIHRYNEVVEAVKEAESRYDCQDFHPKCGEWKAADECIKNPGYMMENCRKTCGACGLTSAFVPETTTKELEARLDKIASELQPLSKDPDQAKTIKDDNAPTQAPIVPRNVVSQQTTHTSTEVASPPPTASPPPPITQTPVTQRPVASPPPVQPSPAAKKTRKQLMVRCYRLNLPLEEVKKCVTDARNNVEYMPQLGTPTGGDSAQQGGSSAGSSDDDAMRAILAGKTDADNNSGSINIKLHDDDDLSLSQHSDEVVVEPTDVPEAPQGQGRVVRRVAKADHPSLVSRLFSWQAIGFWALVGLAVASIVPKLLGLRRRQRSGLRTE